MSDRLTGLHNRGYFLQELALAVGRANHSLIYLELERFEELREEHGQAAANLLLNLVLYRRPPRTVGPPVPRVSVLIPARNEERSIEAAVRDLPTNELNDILHAAITDYLRKLTVQNLTEQENDDLLRYLSANEDLERSTDEKTSAVHFMRFEFSREMIQELLAGADLEFGCDHESYPHSVGVPEETCQALAGDFT